MLSRKFKVYSYYDVILNGTNVGNVTIVYYYEPSYNFISADAIFNRRLREVEGIQLSENWNTYIEGQILSESSAEAEGIALGMVSGIITNSANFTIELHARRHRFDVLIGNIKLILTHEFYIDPAFKQIHAFSSDSYMQFPITTEDDDAIRQFLA
jgi:hypothetical protein